MGWGQRQSPGQGALETPARFRVAVHHGEVLWGWRFKVQPCCQRGSKGHHSPGNRLHQVPEPRQLPAGPWQRPRSGTSAGGTHLLLTMELCQCPANRGTARRWPDAPALSSVVPEAPRPSPAQPALFAHQRGHWQREALRSCLLGAWSARMKGLCGPSSPLQPSPVVLPHLQSIRSSLKPGKSPASPREKPEASRDGEGNVARGTFATVPGMCWSWSRWSGAVTAVSPVLTLCPCHGAGAG